MANIKKIIGREIIDSRGNPTVETDIILTNGIIGRAAVPSGASTGENEALELRDKDPKRYMGKGVLTAVKNINTIIAKKIKGKPADFKKIDKIMLELDGTPNKSKLGANAILSVSMAAAKAAAIDKKISLFRYLGKGVTLPVPMMNIINGGMHADNNLDIQEFMIVPLGFSAFSRALQASVEVFHSLKKILYDKNLATSVGDEGGFAPNLQSNEEALELIVSAIERAGYKPGSEIAIAIDSAASSFFTDNIYEFEGKKVEADYLIDFYGRMTAKYPIVSIEDGLSENDWTGWKKLTDILGKKVQLVGDDIFVTNVKLLQQGIEQKVANSILIKVNQIGSLSETLDSMALAAKNGYTAVVSHRSGETEDTTIAHLSTATACGQIKTGSLSRTDRICKYNELLRIEEELGKKAKYAGFSFKYKSH